MVSSITWRIRQERKLARRATAPMRSSTLPTAPFRVMQQQSCHVGQPRRWISWATAAIATVVAVLHRMGAVERINDQQYGFDFPQKIHNARGIGEAQARALTLSQRHTPVGFVQEVDAGNDGLIIEIVFQTGRSDPALPLLLVVLVGDDHHRSGAPHLLAQEWLAGNEGERGGDRDDALTGAVHGAENAAEPKCMNLWEAHWRGGMAEIARIVPWMIWTSPEGGGS